MTIEKPLRRMEKSMNNKTSKTNSFMLMGEAKKDNSINELRWGKTSHRKNISNGSDVALKRESKNKTTKTKTRNASKKTRTNGSAKPFLGYPRGTTRKTSKKRANDVANINILGIDVLSEFGKYVPFSEMKRVVEEECGLLFPEQFLQTIYNVLATEGAKPLLFVGEPGTGKTALATCLSKHFFNGEPLSKKNRTVKGEPLRIQFYSGIEPSDIVGEIDFMKLGAYTEAKKAEASVISTMIKNMKNKKEAEKTVTEEVNRLMQEIEEFVNTPEAWMQTPLVRALGTPEYKKETVRTIATDYGYKIDCESIEPEFSGEAVILDEVNRGDPRTQDALLSTLRERKIVASTGVCFGECEEQVEAVAPDGKKVVSTCRIKKPLFTVFGTMNEKDAGTSRLGHAFSSRWNMVFFPTIDLAREAKIGKHKLTVPGEIKNQPLINAIVATTTCLVNDARNNKTFSSTVKPTVGDTANIIRQAVTTIIRKNPQDEISTEMFQNILDKKSTVEEAIWSALETNIVKNTSQKKKIAPLRSKVPAYLEKVMKNPKILKGEFDDIRDVCALT